MLNREKYAKEILDIACAGASLCLINGKVSACRDTDCNECDCRRATGSCSNSFAHWCNREYVEPSVDWSKVAVDTPILVRDSDKDKWEKRHFAKYEKGKVYAYSNGRTSWSAFDDGDVRYWKYAKLAEEVQEDGR